MKMSVRSLSLSLSTGHSKLVGRRQTSKPNEDTEEMEKPARQVGCRHAVLHRIPEPGAADPDPKRALFSGGTVERWNGGTLEAGQGL